MKMILLTIFTTLSLFTNLGFASLVITRTANLKSEVQTWSNQVCIWNLLSDDNIRGIVEMKCKSSGINCCPFEIKDGEKVNLSKADISSIFNKNDWGGYHLEFAGPEIIHAEKIGRKVDSSEIEAKIKNELEKILIENPKDQDCSFQIGNLKLNNDVFIRFGAESSWRVEILRPLNTQTTFKFVQESGVTRSQTMGTFDLKLETDVFFTKNAIKPGQEITKEDFEIRKVSVLNNSYGLNSFFRKENFPEGSRAKQSIMAGMPLSPSFIEKIPTVKFGDSVTLILRSDNLKISTKAVVQSPAGIGDTVSVQISKSNKTFHGKLTDSRVVEVWL